jgi:hypothetical protein
MKESEGIIEHFIAHFKIYDEEHNDILVFTFETQTNMCCY